MQQKQNGVFRHAAFTKFTKPIKHLLTSGLTEDFDTEFLYNRFNSQALAAGCSFCNPLKKKKNKDKKHARFNMKSLTGHGKKIPVHNIAKKDTHKICRVYGPNYHSSVPPSPPKKKNKKIGTRLSN